jgi:hypothetical protein
MLREGALQTRRANGGYRLARLFHAFPDERTGVGPLLLRLAVGVAILIQGGLELARLPACLPPLASAFFQRRTAQSAHAGRSTRLDDSVARLQPFRVEERPVVQGSSGNAAYLGPGRQESAHDTRSYHMYFWIAIVPPHRRTAERCRERLEFIVPFPPK